MEGEIDAGRLEQQVGAERHGLSRQLDLMTDHVGAGDEMSLLVEFAIVRQIGLGHHAQHLAAMDDDGRVVEPVRHPERRPDDQNREELARRVDDPGDRPLDFVEQRVLQQQVLDGIGRQTQFGKDHDCRPSLVALGREFQRLGQIVGRIGHAGARHAAGHADEFMGVERIKIGHRDSSHPLLVPRRSFLKGRWGWAMVGATGIEPVATAMSRKGERTVTANCREIRRF